MLKRYGLVSSGVVCLFALIAACSSTDKAPIVGPDGNGGAGGTSGSTNRAGAGGKAGNGGSAGGEVSALAPTIKIVAPAEATDPNSDRVLIENSVTVVCSVTQSDAKGAADVDASTVAIEIVGADGKSIKSTAGTPTENADEYSANFALETIPNGSISFKCSAADKATTPHKGSASIDGLVDHGPEITLAEPADGSAHNALQPLNVEFDTAASKLSADDKQADVTAVVLTVGGVEIPTKVAANGRYEATVKFTDATYFPVIPTGKIPLVISAKNGRKSPGAASQSKSYLLVLDGTGPSSSLVQPADGATIGPSSVLKFTVSDAEAGVDQDTVVVKLNQVDYPFSKTDNNWSVTTAGEYTFNIGAYVSRTSTDTQVTVNILAKDKAGNAAIGLTPVFNLDTQPPIVDLDPGPVWEKNLSGQCSDVFDPVGIDAPNDKQTITNYGRFRAIVWDQANQKAGIQDLKFAYTNRNSVQLFVQYTPTAPLLKDKDGDGVCDEIYTGEPPNQKLPTDKPLPKLTLEPMNAKGSVSYGSSPPPPSLATCATPGGIVTAPKLCGNPPKSDLSAVIHHSETLGEPVIYARDPSEDTSNQVCTGQQWDVATAISTNSTTPTTLGWICIAARATDNVGNVGISTPLRICLDDGTNPHRCDATAPPACTDNCTPPPHFQGRQVRHD